MRYGIPAIFVLITTMCNAQPIRLLCNLDEAQRPVPLSLDLELKQASFGGVQEIEPIGFMSDQFIVWTKIVQYNERSDNSSISTESFLFDRLTGTLTTGFVSTDEPMNGTLGKVFTTAAVRMKNFCDFGDSQTIRSCEPVRGASKIAPYELF